MKTVAYDETKWRLVPVDATKEMIRAGLEKYKFAERISSPEYDLDDAMDIAYSAMLDVAPSCE